MKEKFIISIVLPLITNVLGIITSYILALNLDVKLMGDWAYINTVVSIGFLFINIGFDYIHYQYSGKKDFDNYSGSYIILKLGLLLLNLILVISIISFLGLWSEPYLFALLVLIGSQATLSFNNIYLAFFRAKSKIFKCELTLFFSKLIKSTAILILALNISLFYDPILVLSGIYTLSEILSVIIFTIISKRDITFKKPKKELILAYIKDAKPLFLVSIIFIFSQNFGNLILDYTYGRENLAYFYVVNVNIVTVLISIIMYLRPFLTSQYANFFEKGDISSIKSITYTIERYASIFYLILIIIFILNGDLLFLIFLPDYTASVPIMYVLIFAPYLSGLARPYFFQLIPGRKQKQSALIEISETLIVLILMIVLIPQNIFSINMLGLGAIGYALAVTVPRVYKLIFSRYYSYKFFKISGRKEVIYHFLIAVFCCIIGILMKLLIFQPLITNSILLLLVSTSIPLFIFILFLVGFKFLRRADLRFIIDLLNVKSYTNSMKDEFK